MKKNLGLKDGLDNMKTLLNLIKKTIDIFHKFAMGFGAVMLLFLLEHISKNELFITPDWIKWTLHWIMALGLFFLIGHAIKDFEMKSRGE